MLNFINKKGKKVMEVHDDGKTVIFQESDKKPFPEELTRKKEEEQENEQ